MDDTDAKILGLLRDNSRMKNTEIARHVGLTERAVRARIEKLVREGVIRKFTIETSPVGVEGIVLVGANIGRTSAVKERPDSYRTAFSSAAVTTMSQSGSRPIRSTN
jgi:DNA-binding Lrp family transcriptional regulator